MHNSRCRFRDYPQTELCPQHPRDTNPDDWETIFEEYVLRASNPDDYFFETIAGFLIADHRSGGKTEPAYYTFFSNEVIHHNH
jgi:hypothetical protein